MRPLLTVAALLGVVLGLRWLSRRLASYQEVIPRVASRVNTQVHRINQPR